MALQDLRKKLAKPPEKKKKKRPTYKSFVKPGIWLPGIKVEVQAVKKAHRLACAACRVVPETRRLMVKEGGGRSQTTTVFCVACGVDWIEDRKAEARLTQKRLKTGEGCCRLYAHERRVLVQDDDD